MSKLRISRSCSKAVRYKKSWRRRIGQHSPISCLWYSRSPTFLFISCLPPFLPLVARFWVNNSVKTAQFSLWRPARATTCNSKNHLQGPPSSCLSLLNIKDHHLGCFNWGNCHHQCKRHFNRWHQRLFTAIVILSSYCQCKCHCHHILKWNCNCHHHNDVFCSAFEEPLLPWPSTILYYTFSDQIKFFLPWILA